MKNRPEDLAFFAAVTLEQPVQAFNYSSGDDLAYQTSFGDVAAAYAGDGGGAPGVPGVTGGPVGAMPAPAGAQRFQEAQQAGGGVAVQAAGRGAEDRAQRSVLVRLRQEVQEVSWSVTTSSRSVT